MLHFVMNAFTYMNLINGGATQLIADKCNEIAKTN